MFKLNKLSLLKKVIDGRTPEYLITSLDSLRFEHKYIVSYQNKNIIPLTEAQNRRNEEHILLVSGKELNALNLEITISFSSMKTTLTTPLLFIENTHSFGWNLDQQREDTFISAKKRLFGHKLDSITIFAF